MEGIDLFLGAKEELSSIIQYELRPGTSALNSKDSFSTGLAAKVDFHVPGGVVTKIGIEKEDKSFESHSIQPKIRRESFLQLCRCRK